MTNWVIDALEHHDGKATIIEISKYVWDYYGEKIKRSGDMFYKWQYEIRWAGNILRKKGVLRPTGESPRGVWKLSDDYLEILSD